jgi:hypothetical protein
VNGLFAVSRSGPGRLVAAALAAALAAAAAGCSSAPDAANIVLRKQNQQLTDQVAQLQRDNAGLEAQVQAIQSKPGSTIPQLPQSRLDQLFTTCGLQFGSLTGGYSDNSTGPDQMVKVYVVPTDQQGEPIKAAGSFTVDLLDLAEPNPRLGEWNFSIDQAKADWFGRFFLYTYVLDCPWQIPPRHAKLMLRVQFTDALTGRQFTATRNITVKPPLPTTATK